jgi:hypothetical protein
MPRLESGERRLFAYRLEIVSLVIEMNPVCGEVTFGRIRFKTDWHTSDSDSVS